MGLCGSAPAILLLYPFVESKDDDVDDGLRTNQALFKCQVRVRLGSSGLGGLLRFRMIIYDAFDWAQLNPDESSELIRLIPKIYGRVRMSLTRAHAHERT